MIWGFQRMERPRSRPRHDLLPEGSSPERPTLDSVQSPGRRVRASAQNTNRTKSHPWALKPWCQGQALLSAFCPMRSAHNIPHRRAPLVECGGLPGTVTGRGHPLLTSPNVSVRLALWGLGGGAWCRAGIASRSHAGTRTPQV